jgi:hypothetical protein
VGRTASRRRTVWSVKYSFAASSTLAASGTDSTRNRPPALSLEACNDDVGHASRRASLSFAMLLYSTASFGWSSCFITDNDTGAMTTIQACSVVHSIGSSLSIVSDNDTGTGL